MQVLSEKNQEILHLPVKDKEIFIFPETKETSKSVTSVGVEIIAIPRCSSDYDEVLTHIGVLTFRQTSVMY